MLPSVHDEAVDEQDAESKLALVQADYILGGAFASACERGAVLTNALMKEINKDVCNRFYTLWEKGMW